MMMGTREENLVKYKTFIVGTLVKIQDV
jgi:hypothetical protein